MVQPYTACIKKKPNNMNEIIIILAIIVVIYIPAHWAKFAFSGKGFSNTKLWILMIYNIYAGSLHMYFLEKGHIPFYGSMDRFPLGWLSALMIFLHISAIPTTWKRRPWRLRKRFDPKIRKHKLTFDRYRLAQPRKSILFFWKRS